MPYPWAHVGAEEGVVVLARELRSPLGALGDAVACDEQGVRAGRVGRIIPVLASAGGLGALAVGRPPAQARIGRERRCHIEVAVVRGASERRHQRLMCARYMTRPVLHDAGYVTRPVLHDAASVT